MTKTTRFLALLFFVLSSSGFSQGTKPTSPMEEVLSSITVGARFSYFSPKLDNTSTAFSAVADSLGLSQAPLFKISYLAGAYVRYALTPQHSVGIDMGMSVAKSRSSHAQSIERIYTVGAQYYYSFRSRERYNFGLDAGVGGGLMVVNFEQDFDGQRLSVLKKSATANASVVGWVAPVHMLFLELEVRYIFVPNISIAYPQSTLKMSSLAVGAGISVGL